MSDTAIEPLPNVELLAGAVIPSRLEMNLSCFDSVTKAIVESSLEVSSKAYVSVGDFSFH